MSFTFLLPDIGEGMATAEIVGWHVAVGDVVALDQALVSVETDKVVTDLPSPVSGEIIELGAQEGDTVDVGAVLVVIQPEAGVTPPVPEVAPPSAGPAPARRVKAAPAVRKLALESGIPLDGIAGTGPGGRVTREDVLTAASAPVTPTAVAVAAPGERIPLRGLRRQIARNMVESWTRIPQAVDFREIDATHLIEARRVAAAFAPEGTPLTYLALMVKIAAAALREHPIFNAQLDEEAEEIVVAADVNVGIATATPDGVIVPVVHAADTKSVYEIAREIDDLAERARRRAVTGAELSGGTFTVNNTGALGPSGGAFPTPLINWPEAAILAFGRITDRVAAVDGAVVVRPTLMLTVTADHRLVDGAGLVAFTNSITDMIEKPDRRLGALGP